MNLNDYLGKNIDIIIDRPLGSKHPKFKDLIYPINYGYMPNTKNDDGEEIDVYIIGINKSLKKFSGRVIAIIHRLNDNDDKLVAVKNNYQPSDQEIEKAINFQEKYFNHKIIR